MKKLLILLFSLLLVCGCEKRHSTIPVEDKTVKQKVDLDTPIENKYKDENSFPISFYTNRNGTLIKLSEKKESFVQKKDITTVQVFPSTEDSYKIDTKLGTAFGNKWQELDKDHKIKQGFIISYELTNGTKINQKILGPSTTQLNYDYIEIYLYDAYKHRNDNWYSHIEEKEFNNDTYMTSIKLTAGSKYNEISSKITLTTFTYDTDDDFDENGNYRGNSKSTITICDLNKTC